ncbi:hypothetical protein QOZ80_1AG0014950 [Eleusine coracana subsp. coracana]|nr:hypothetical protein QOZ80_1AG0014950 [Eleusine coracana subsp. coracana]
MPGRDHFSRLPDDLVAGILALLPPRQVARARLVSQRWHSVTTDHHFLRASFSYGRPILGFFTGVTSDYFPLRLETDEEAAAEPEAARDRLSPDLSFIPGTGSADAVRDRVQVRGSCCGLLLLRCGSISYVCNALTKKMVPIFQPPALCVNLAFDPSKSRHYKVIALAGEYNVHVYSSETRSWRMAVHRNHSAGLFVELRSLRGVFWNGSVIWNLGHSLLRFVIEEEYLTNLPMPSKEKGWICAYIGESGGHLQMIGYTKREKIAACFDILEMQEGQSEWSILYRVDLSQVKELYPDIEWPTWDTRYRQQKIIDYLALSPIYVIRGTGKTGQLGVLVFSIPGKVMSYNMQDQEISMVKEIWSPFPSEQFWYNFYAYNCSLFDP